METELKDKIKFKVEVDDRGLKVKISYEQEIETADAETESETEYEVRFDRIVEYRQSLSSGFKGAFDWDESIVVSELLLTDFEPFSEIGNYDGSKYVFAATTSDGMATFTFTISQGQDGESITANKMKIDFELNGFRWADDDNYVALISHVESEREVEIEYENGDKRKTEDVIISFDDVIGERGIRPFGEFTWAKEAMVYGESKLSDQTDIELMANQVDSAEIEVVATSPQSNSAKVAFSFVGESAKAAPTIYWDPEAGIAYSTSTSSSSVRYVAFAGVLCALSFLAI